MILTQVNYLAVLAGGFLAMFVGSLWYGPLFGKVWMKLSGFGKKDMDKAKDMGMGKIYFAAFVGALVMSFAVANIVKFAQAANLLEGIVAGGIAWLVVANVLLGNVLWEGKPVKLYLIHASHYLVLIVGMAVIHTLWV